MKVRKGVELPINTMIVLALGLFVLVMVIYYVVGGFKPMNDANADSAVQQGCQKYASMGGDINAVETIMVGDLDNDGTGDTLLKACRMFMNNPTMEKKDCVNICASKFPGLIDRAP